MIETLHGLVLERVRHNDKSDIVSLYTRERGRVPFVVQGGQSRGARMRRAMLMPLSVVEVTMRSRPSQELQRFSSLSVARQFPSIYGDPVKSAVAIFLREFLSRLLREYPADDMLWEYIVRSLAVLDASEGHSTANFHIIFLANLTGPLGIRPDIERSRSGLPPYFDLRAAAFCLHAPLHHDVLRGEEARIVHLLSRLDFRNGGRLRLNRMARQRLLEGLLRFYSLHFSGLDSMRSPEILQSLFD
ncbi:MAG: DNA repair protein RecO [Bacteroidales bacterium]|nr:DNA repair protein RecO [Bacteroidales bacterium]